MAFSFFTGYKIAMKRFFYLGSEKLVRLFVQKVLKGAGHDVYVAESVNELYVIKDLNSQIILIDACLVSSLPQGFFEEGREYVVIGAEAEFQNLDLNSFHKKLQKPLGMTDLLSL